MIQREIQTKGGQEMYIIEEWQSQSLESPVSIATPVQKENYNEAEGEMNR